MFGHKHQVTAHVRARVVEDREIHGGSVRRFVARDTLELLAEQVMSNASVNDHAVSLPQRWVVNIANNSKK
jgi:hypothetical protein